MDFSKNVYCLELCRGAGNSEIFRGMTEIISLAILDGEDSDAE
jgi:hypothetical protein